MTTQYITDIAQAATVLANNNIELITFEHNIRYDADLSSIYYNDFIKGYTGVTVQSFGNRQTDYLVVYGDDVKMTDDYYDINYLESLSNDELIELLDGLQFYNYDEDDREDLIYQLQQFDNEDYYSRHFDSVNWYNLDSDFNIAGYSQGDNIKVKLLGNAGKYYDEGSLTHLFYDAPISGSVNVYSNGELIEELFVNEYLDDCYNWDKVQFINNVSNTTLNDGYHVLLNQWLLDNLNDELKYSY